jgi:hypothetical protein
MGAPWMTHQEDVVPSTTIADLDDTDGVSMTMSQLGRSVIRGQRITAWLPEGGSVSGYLAGMDDDYWFILQPDEGAVRQRLVPRVPRPALEIHIERTFEKESQRRQMERTIVHLRTWFKRNVFKPDNDVRNLL